MHVSKGIHIKQSEIKNYQAHFPSAEHESETESEDEAEEEASSHPAPTNRGKQFQRPRGGGKAFHPLPSLRSGGKTMHGLAPGQCQPPSESSSEEDEESSKNSPSPSHTGKHQPSRESGGGCLLGFGRSLNDSEEDSVMSPPPIPRTRLRKLKGKGKPVNEKEGQEAEVEAESETEDGDEEETKGEDKEMEKTVEEEDTKGGENQEEQMEDKEELEVEEEKEREEEEVNNTSLPLGMRVVVGRHGFRSPLSSQSQGAGGQAAGYESAGDEAAVDEADGVGLSPRKRRSGQTNRALSSRAKYDRKSKKK